MIFCRKLSKVIRQLAQPPRLFLRAGSKVEMISAIFEQLLSLASHVLEWVRLMQRILTVDCDTAVTSELRWKTVLFAHPSGWMSFLCSFLSFYLVSHFHSVELAFTGSSAPHFQPFPFISVWLGFDIGQRPLTQPVPGSRCQDENRKWVINTLR